MTHMDIVKLAFDILCDADVVEEFEDTLFIKIDKEMWGTFWDALEVDRQQ